MGYLVPGHPGNRRSMKTEPWRQPAEAALTQLLCVAATLTPGQHALLKQTVAQVDLHESRHVRAVLHAGGLLAGGASGAAQAAYGDKRLILLSQLFG